MTKSEADFNSGYELGWANGMSRASAEIYRRMLKEHDKRREEGRLSSKYAMVNGFGDSITFLGTVLDDLGPAYLDKKGRIPQVGIIPMLNATGQWWMIGKGRSKEGEPLWGCLIQEPKIGGKNLAQAEGDELAEVVERAIAMASAP